MKVGINGAILVNKAICPSSKDTSRLHAISFEALTAEKISRLPSWAKHNGVSSFSLDMVQKHFQVLVKRGFEGITLKEVEVECTTVNGVIEDHLKNALVDYIQIDVEGFDYNILKQLNLQRWKPLLIKWEHKHLNGVSRQLAENFVQEAGYYVTRSETDTLAYKFWSC